MVGRSRWPLTHRCTPRASPTLVRQQVARASQRSRAHSIVFHEGICSASPTGPERLADHDVMLLETCRRVEVGQKTRGVGSSLSLSPSPSPPPLYSPFYSPPPCLTSSLLLFCSSAPSVYECMNRSISLHPTPRLATNPAAAPIIEVPPSFPPLRVLLFP